MSTKYQIFISSTFKDLHQERRAVIEAVLDLGHIPSGMEIFPAADVEQFRYIKKVIDECDYYVLIIGGRYGSIDSSGISFTEREYDYAVKRKKTVLAFIHSDPESIAVKNSDTKPSVKTKLNEFRTKVSKRRLVGKWTKLNELKPMVVTSLVSAFKEKPGVGWIRGDAAASQDLLAESNRLHGLVENLRAENAELKEMTKSRLELSFDQSRDECKTRINGGIFVHVLARNLGTVPIQNCEAILASVLRNGQSVGYLSLKNLSWSQPPDGAPEKYGRIMLADGVEPHLIDVFGTGVVRVGVDGGVDGGVPCFWLRIADAQPLLFTEPGSYRLAIKVSGSGTASVSIALLVDWKGDPHDVGVRVTD
jgi:hypothetical protein